MAGLDEQTPVSTASETGSGEDGEDGWAHG
jgi:hypothetical protein